MAKQKKQQCAVSQFKIIEKNMHGNWKNKNKQTNKMPNKIYNQQSIVCVCVLYNLTARKSDSIIWVSVLRVQKKKKHANFKIAKMRKKKTKNKNKTKQKK